jgi:hypothetical protein
VVLPILLFWVFTGLAAATPPKNVIILIGDGDVDGSDFARLIMGLGSVDISVFSEQFAGNDCF